jgi:menaquinone-dependent protoporphyrinogen oxidase
VSPNGTTDALASHEEALLMRIALFYATREGQTAKIAEHIAQELQTSHVRVDVFDVGDLDEPVDWPSYDAACVAASVHIGRHESEMIKFVKHNRRDLEQLSAMFLSVSLSEAGVEDPDAPPERREKAAADVRGMIDTFVKDTGWRPEHILPVAGALAYSRYNFVIRFVMKRIARANGAPTDTSRDYVLTDWDKLDRFVRHQLSVALAA